MRIISDQPVGCWSWEKSGTDVTIVVEMNICCSISCKSTIIININIRQHN